MKIPKPIIHPSANKKLISAFRSVKRETGVWNIRETARRLGVNQKYVHENLMRGIEPSNREIRAKLFQLKPRKPRKESWLAHRIKLMAARTKTAVMSKTELKREEKETRKILEWLNG